MEPEPMVDQPAQSEHVEPQIVSKSENQVETNMVESSEAPTHLAEHIKIGCNGESEATEQQHHVENEKPPETIEAHDSENISKTDHNVHQSEETQEVPPKEQPISAEEPEPKAATTEEHDQGAVTSDTPVINGETNHVPLAELAQKANEQHEVPPEQQVDQSEHKEEDVTGVPEPSVIVKENGQIEETATELQEGILIQKGLADVSNGRPKVEPSDYILPKTEEGGKMTIPCVTIDPISGEEITVTHEEIQETKEEIVNAELKPEVGEEVRKSATMGSLEKSVEPKQKKKRRFHLSFNRRGEDKPFLKRKADSLDRGSQRSIGTNIKNYWAGFSRSLRRKEKTPEPPKSKERPPRPPPVTHRFEAKTHLHGDLDQQSLQSVSAVSISNSPIVSRKHLIQEALPDFAEALRSDSMEIAAENHTGEIHNQERILAWTASHAAGNMANEVSIQPTQRQNPYTSADHVKLRSSAGHSSPKPPRPTSPPSLSPLDYQHYYSEDGMSQSEIIQQRMNLVQAMTPPGSDVNVQLRGSTSVARSPSAQVAGGSRPITTSLDREQQMRMEYHARPTVRRAQTLRPDYADRLRERVLSLRVEPGDTHGETGTLRARKPRAKKETYVCSDTIKFPKLNFKLSRKQKDKSPALVHPEKSEVVIPRPQPNFVASAPDDRRFWVQQQITNNYEPVVCKTERMVSSLPPSLMTHQLTNLPSMTGKQYGRTKVSVIGLNRNAPEYDLSKTYYISGEIRGQLEGGDDTEKLKEVIRMTQPFLVAWDGHESEGKPRENSLNQMVDCIRSYLNTCVRLRGADLHGHFSPLHYQLANFDTGSWRNVARLGNLNDPLIVSGADGTAEYLQFVPAQPNQSELLYTLRCVDLMLTNWFDRHHSNPKILEGSSKQIVYQPISFVSNLKVLVELNPFTSSHLNALFQLGIRLAVLLAYESGLNQVTSSNLKPVTALDQIILGWSTSNCITLFHMEQKPVEAPSQPNGTEHVTKEDTAEDKAGSDIDVPEEQKKEDSKVDPLLQQLCPDYTTVESAIDGLIEKVHQVSTEQLNPDGIGSYLLKSIAPPDWMAMLVARVAMHKI